MSSHTVQTVLGALQPAYLGHIQCHEHIWLRKGPSYACNPALRIDDFEKSLQELLAYRAAGGGAIVDAQPGGFGRDAQALADLSQRSGVQILAVTGFHKLAFLEPDAPLRGLSAPELTRYFCRELTQGLLRPDGSRCSGRAALIKAAYERGGWQDPGYAPLFEAVAQSAAKTGAPVIIHTEPGNDIPALLAWFSARGVPPERMMLCHLDRTHPDPAYHRKTLSSGCMLCYDSIHRYRYVSDAQELSLLQSVLDAGFARQIVLSLDTTNQRLRAYSAADMGLDTILLDFLPYLRANGIEDRRIEAMCRSNAARFLQFIPSEVSI